MYPILARTEAGFVYTFSVVWVIGIACAFGITWQRANAAGVPTRRVVDLFLACGAGAVIGGRLAFVGLNWDFFAENTLAVFHLAGGLAYSGVLLGGMAAYGMYQHMTAMALGLPAAALVTLYFTGWGACYFDGCAYGEAAVTGPLVMALPDSFGVVTGRYATQLGGILLTGAVGGIMWLRPRLRGSWIGTLGLLCAVHFFVGFFRGDTMPLLFGLRLDGWVDLLVIFVAVGLLIWPADNS